METDRRPLFGLHPAWWMAVMLVVITAFVAVSWASFNRSFSSTVPVTLTSDRSGLVMQSGAKVKLRGAQVGQVAQIIGGDNPVALRLQIDSSQIRYIPANVGAEIKATTVFGAKYVELIYPENPSPQRLAAGTVLQSRNVSSEVNTVFQNLVALLHQIDPAKLNAVLGALAEGVRGQGGRMGQAITDSNQVLEALNARADTLGQNWRSLKGFSDTYAAAAQDLLNTFDAASTTSATVTKNVNALDALLLNTSGFANSGINLLAPNQHNLIDAINVLAPTTDLLLKYNPEYTCLLMGADYFLHAGGGLDIAGGENGSSITVDDSLVFGNDPYRYPDNLPVIAAKGGPGGKPGCGSLPVVDKNWPVRQLVTNSGFGTGLDWRPNPGIGFPGYANYLPVTRAVPEPPSVRDFGGPAPGPIPYPGAPPYGAPLYAPDGTPLYPGVPPAPVAPSPDSSSIPPTSPPAAPTP